MTLMHCPPLLSCVAGISIRGVSWLGHLDWKRRKSRKVELPSFMTFLTYDIFSRKKIIIFNFMKERFYLLCSLRNGGS